MRIALFRSYCPLGLTVTNWEASPRRTIINGKLEPTFKMQPGEVQRWRFIHAGLRKLGTWPGLLLTALFFGLAHASIYRLLPTFTLGLLIGVVRWRTGSVFCGMLIHLLNNGLLGTLAQKPPKQALAD